MQTHYTVEELDAVKDYIKRMNVTFVFEVILVDKDPHMIKYEEDTVVLLDIIYNTLDFRHMSYEMLQFTGVRLGFSVKRKAKTLNNWNEFVSWYETEVNIPENNILEGFVLEDAEGFMTKIKTDYYNFWKRMRYVANEIAKNGFIKKQSLVSEPLAHAFYTWLLIQPKEVQALDIISLRDRFYGGK